MRAVIQNLLIDGRTDGLTDVMVLKNCNVL